MVARQILGSVLGVKIPQRPIDDLVTETIAGDPALRWEWAGVRLQDIKRNVRSELDIVGKGLELVISVVRELEKGARPRVVSEAVTSGELRETLLGLTGVLNEGSPATEKGIIDDPISQPCDARRRSWGKKPIMKRWYAPPFTPPIPVPVEPCCCPFLGRSRTVR